MLCFSHEQLFPLNLQANTESLNKRQRAINNISFINGLELIKLLTVSYRFSSHKTCNRRIGAVFTVARPGLHTDARVWRMFFSTVPAWDYVPYFFWYKNKRYLKELESFIVLNEIISKNEKISLFLIIKSERFSHFLKLFHLGR
jgi:hypothetical protein